MVHPTWQPTASIVLLRKRAEMLQQIRAFFAARNILEVETPLLCQASVPDPHILSFEATYATKKHYLQTSPEFAMKRLLAAGSGPIYQICKAFRDEESGQMHNPEFSMLEWYQPGYSSTQLMDEVEEMVMTVGSFAKSIRMSYEAVFKRYLDINPHTATMTELQNCAATAGLNKTSGMQSLDKDGWLFLLMSHCIEPHLGHEQPVFIDDFPVSQAALARVKPDNPLVAERFELYIAGSEIANGFNELTDAKEQRQRFVNDLNKRQQLGISQIPLDENFLAALEFGLPECSGVALGIDRLLMQITKVKTVDEVISFTIANA